MSSEFNLHNKREIRTPYDQLMAIHSLFRQDLFLIRSEYYTARSYCSINSA